MSGRQTESGERLVRCSNFVERGSVQEENGRCGNGFGTAELALYINKRCVLPAGGSCQAKEQERKCATCKPWTVGSEFALNENCARCWQVSSQAVTRSRFVDSSRVCVIVVVVVVAADAAVRCQAPRPSSLATPYRYFPCAVIVEEKERKLTKCRLLVWLRRRWLRIGGGDVDVAMSIRTSRIWKKSILG